MNTATQTPDPVDADILHIRRTEELRRLTAYAHQAEATARLQTKARPFSIHARLQVLLIHQAAAVFTALLALFETYRPTLSETPTQTHPIPQPAPTPATLNTPHPPIRRTTSRRPTAHRPTPARAAPIPTQTAPAAKPAKAKAHAAPPTAIPTTPNHPTPTARPHNPPAHRAGAAPNPNPHPPARHPTRQAA